MIQVVGFMVVKGTFRFTGILFIALLILQLSSTLITAQSLVSFELLGYEYTSAIGTAEIYPGSRNVMLKIYVLYEGSTKIQVSAGCLNLPQWFRISRGWLSCTSPTSPNGTTYTTVDPGDVALFEYSIDVDEEALPGNYELSITLYYRMLGSTEFQQLTLPGILIKVSEFPPLRVEVVDWWWRPAGYPGSEGISLYITLRNSGRTYISRAEGLATFEQGFATPSKFDFQVLNLEANASTIVILGPISVNSSVHPGSPYRVVLEINATLRTVDGVAYSSNGMVEFNITVSQPLRLNLEVVEYGLTAVKPTNNAVMARLYLTLLNKDFRTARLVVAKIEVQTDRALFVDGSLQDIIVYEGVLTYGGTATLMSSPLLIQGVSEIPVKVALLVFGDDNGAEFWVEVDYELSITLVEPNIHLEIVETYWSSIPAYSTTQSFTYNVVVLNRDVVTIRDAVAVLELPECFYPRRVVLSGVMIGSGEMATLSFTGISVQNPGVCKSAKLTITGISVDAGTGVFFEFKRTYVLDVDVANLTTRQGLRVIDAYWYSRWSVYPFTENATLTVLIANLWPYQVVAVDFELILPQGFYSKTGNRSREYVGGPIGPYQEFIVNFEISTGNVEAGTYIAILRARYTVLATPMIEVEEEFHVSIHVSSLEEAISIVGVQWIGKAPEPPEYGAVLQVVVRNNHVSSMRGLVLELDLPAEITWSDTNGSKAKVAATNVDLLRRLQPEQLLQLPLTAELFGALVQQAGATSQGISIGDLAYFYLRLNVLVEKPGIYRSTGYLNFIDHWNNVRRIPIEVQIAVLGSTKVVRVHTPSTVEVKKGVVMLTVGLENTGGSPIFDAYVYIYPHVPILVPVEAVKYTGVLPPGYIINTTLLLVYNPVGAMVGGVQTYLRYTAVPFTVAIVYKDVHGFTRVFNTTFAVLLEPFIDLVLSSTQAYITRRELVVSGILSNTGLAAARSVVLRAVFGNVSKDLLIGDLDPATQTAFRLEIEDIDSRGRVVELYVYYRDEYGRTEVLISEIPVTVVEVKEELVAPSRQPTFDHTYVIIAVAVFLTGVALLIYRYLKVHSKKLEKLLNRQE